MGKIVAVCISEKKGTAKQNVGFACFIENFGVEGDAHAGKWHRQVSLLSFDEVERFRARGANVADGAFGENLLVEGFDFKTYPVGTIFACNEVLLEITQIGKKCHSECEIFHQVGDCIMPREGVFARVLRGGTVSVGDELIIGEKPWNYTAAIVVASDKGSKGERRDASGPAIRELIEPAGYHVRSEKILPDDEDMLYRELVRLADEEKVDVIFTTGGTGLSSRDNTPEATLRAADKNVPGIAEAIRAYSLSITPRAMLSRAVSVMRGKTLIINLPGSPKAVRESLEYILPSLGHGLEIMRGDAKECGSDAAITDAVMPETDSMPPNVSAPVLIRSDDMKAVSVNRELLTERHLKMEVNGRIVADLVCTPSDLENLTVGWLVTEGIISDLSDIESIEILEKDNSVRISLVNDNSEEKKPFKDDKILYNSIDAPEWRHEWVFSAVNAFAEDAGLHKRTGGAHGCMLVVEGSILYRSEDIGRHNAIDKVVGYAVRERIDRSKCMIFTTGRVPVDMLMKVVAARIPILVSKSVPTAEAVEMAKKHGITLICRAWPDSFEVYSENNY